LDASGIWRDARDDFGVGLEGAAFCCRSLPSDAVRNAVIEVTVLHLEPWVL
jgi:hypothetical protein